MTEIRAREPVLLAQDFSALVAWYQQALGFQVLRLFEDDYHYCNLETATGVRLGVGSADGQPPDRTNGALFLQLEVDDLPAFFAQLERAGASITGGPSLDRQGGFWFGSFADPEGNVWWVVDKNCP